MVFSAYQTLNHVAAVRYRLRAGFFSRYVRVLLVLAMLLLGALATGALTVGVTALTSQPGLERVAAVLGSALVVFAVLLFGAKLLLPRPPDQGLWPGAILGALAVTAVLNVGPPLLARLVVKPAPSMAALPPWQACSRCCIWSVRRWYMRPKSGPSATPGCGRGPWTWTAPPRPMSVH